MLVAASLAFVHFSKLATRTSFLPRKEELRVLTYPKPTVEICMGHLGNERCRTAADQGVRILLSWPLLSVKIAAFGDLKAVLT